MCDRLKSYQVITFVNMVRILVTAIYLYRDERKKEIEFKKIVNLLVWGSMGLDEYSERYIATNVHGNPGRCCTDFHSITRFGIRRRTGTSCLGVGKYRWRQSGMSGSHIEQWNSSAVTAVCILFKWLKTLRLSPEGYIFRCINLQIIGKDDSPDNGP